MTKRDAIEALVKALAGDDADDVPTFGTTAEAIAFLAECLTSDSGTVTFELPSE